MQEIQLLKCGDTKQRIFPLYTVERSVCRPCVFRDASAIGTDGFSTEGTGPERCRRSTGDRGELRRIGAVPSYGMLRLQGNLAGSLVFQTSVRDLFTQSAGILSATLYPEI